MINHSLKCIFVHVPKTAGTSIINTLGGFEESLHQIGRHNKPSIIKHKAGRFWDNYFKFTFVRNPFDRVYSIYSYYKMGDKVTLVDPNRISDTFEGFVVNIDTNLKKLGLDYNISDYLDEGIDYIGKFESLDDDFRYICNRIGVNQRSLKHNRKSKRKNDYRDAYITNEMKEIVGDYFSKDIKQYNYEF